MYLSFFKDIVDADGCGHKESPVPVSKAAALTTPLIEDYLSCCYSLVKEMLRVAEHVIHFMTHPS